MKQLLQHLRTGETEVAEVPIPHPGRGTALVLTGASLVSAGTERTLVEFAGKSLAGKARSRPDMVRQVADKARREGLMTTVEAVFNRLEQPMPLGYSSAGTIVEVGEGLTGFKVGDRVACAGGGHAVHAEYAVVPQNLLAPIPEGVSFEEAAFATLGAISMHGFRLADIQVGSRVAVIGLGLLGLLSAGIARAAGCEVIGIDVNPIRTAFAIQQGIRAVERADAVDAVQAFTRGMGADAVLICADTPSNDPVELAGQLARDRARVVAVGAVGLDIPRKLYYEKELTFLVSRSYGPGRYDPDYEEAGRDYPPGFVRWTEGRNLEAVLGLVAAGSLWVKELITHRFPIGEAPSAYNLITGKVGEPFLGVILTYPEPHSDNLDQGRIINLTDSSKPAAGNLVLGALGAGNFASGVLFPIMKKTGGVTLKTVISANGASARSAASRFGFSSAATLESEVLDDPQVNIAAVLTRHNQHARQVISALQHGKHVFCEKPLAIRPEELDGLVAALEANPDCLLMMGFNRRFAPLSLQLKAFLEPRVEPFTAHYRVNAGYLPPGHWLHDPEQGGGRIIGEGCHFIDYLTFLAGQPPVRVYAQALPDSERYRQDNAVITLTFPDGSLGTLTYTANGDKSFPKERLEVLCAGKVAALDDFRTLELAKNGKIRQARSRLQQDKGHQAEWEAFLKAVRAGGPPPIPYEHLLGVSRATFAAMESLRSGEPVTIPG